MIATAKNDLPKLVLTADETAKVLMVSDRTLYNLTAPRGTLPVAKIGRTLRYLMTDVQKWLEDNKVTA